MPEILNMPEISPNFPADSAFALQTVDLGRDYRMGSTTIHALHGINIGVRHGEFVAVMGPSGCGKSTLVNLLGGLDTPTHGAIWLDQHNLADYNEEQLASLRRAKMGFVFQRHDLFPALTALENVTFPMVLNGTPASERTMRGLHLLEQVQLDHKADSLPDELSGGQQQRVGIARALANNPLLLMADEPTGNLDSASASDVIALLTGLVREQRLTVIMVTHDPDSARYADRVLHLSDGALVSEQVNQKPSAPTISQVTVTQTVATHSTAAKQGTRS